MIYLKSEEIKIDFTQKISTSGNSLILVIPSQVVELHRLRKGDWLTVTADKIKDSELGANE